MNSRPPKSDTDGAKPPEGPTDFTSLMSEPVIIEAERPKKGAGEKRTDIASLQEGWEPTIKRRPPRGLTDVLTDFFPPFLIFVMVTSVVFFLLDIRYVYTEVHDKNLRFVAFCFLMGIVALNRLVVREGKEDSMLYILGLGVTIGLYTLGTTTAFEVGSVARDFLNRPYIALAFNLTVVAFVWWTTNRLTHECCVDENPLAGDMGILTGTFRRFHKALRSGPKKKWKPPTRTFDPVDPTEWKKPEKKKAPLPLDAVDRLPKRHPGVSVLYFSIPAMFLFAFGIRVAAHGGPRMIIAGYAYLVLYTVSALLLLMLTSLGQLRAYFRSRRIHIPGGLGPFWLGLGVFMVAVVVFGAAALPNPGLPPLAYISHHEIDFWSRTSTFQPIDVNATQEQLDIQSRFIRYIGYGVLACLGLFFAYAGLKGLGAVAIAAARRRRHLPRFLVRFFDWLDRFLQRITRLPTLPKIRRRIRVDRNVSASVEYLNPLADPERAAQMSANDQVEHAYEALCALALDMGIPRTPDQTPYEFMASFPDQLDSLREEASELTELYVATAYAARTHDERVLDRLRKFWHTYERMRSYVVR